MRVLVISRNAWDDTNAIGNTLSNFFSEIDDLEFAGLYFRESRPNNKLCRTYFKTSEFDVLKKWFSPGHIGKKFNTTDEISSNKNSADHSNEKKLISIIHKYGLKLAYRLSDYIWYSEKWINKNLEDFIKDFSPDIVFTFVKSAPQYYLTVRYLREKFDIPVVSWIADDEYTGLSEKNNSCKEVENLRYILKESSVVFACSQELSDYYNSVFGCKATPLYKACNRMAPIKEKTNADIRLIYGGNLLYGRLEIIEKIAQVVEDIGNNSQAISLEIYSNTALLSSEIDEKFGNLRHTKYMGRCDYDELMKKFELSDIVLHIESFEESEILKTRYSFSTKIIDCLQSGSLLLAVGPAEISSLKYISKIPGAAVIDNPQQLRKDMMSLLSDPASFIGRAKEIRQFAEKYHDSQANAKKMRETLQSVIKEEL